ncbi:reverse transcriptase, partial [Globisporangium splendens]
MHSIPSLARGVDAKVESLELGVWTHPHGLKDDGRRSVMAPPPPTLPGLAAFLQRSSSQESIASSGSGSNTPPSGHQHHLARSRETGAEYFTADAMLLKRSYRRVPSRTSSYSDTDGSPTLHAFKHINLRASGTRHSLDANTSMSSSTTKTAMIMSSNYKSKSESSSSARPQLLRTSRYLREIDRRNILRRIENGEKQADLAKEYQVSRAAISNLKQRRHRKDNMREDEEDTDTADLQQVHHERTLSQQLSHLHQHVPTATRPQLPQGLAVPTQTRERHDSHHHHQYLDVHRVETPPQPHQNYEQRPADAHYSPFISTQVTSVAATMAGRPSSVTNRSSHYPQGVTQVTIGTMDILFAQLVDQRTGVRTFDIIVKRMVRLLLEHAMGLFPTRDFEIAASTASANCVGVGYTKPTCAVALTDRGALLLREFQETDPYSDTGYISFPQTSSAPVVELPQRVGGSNILLLDSFCSQSGHDLLFAIKSILAAGGLESDIYIVTILSHEEGLLRQNEVIRFGGNENEDAASSRHTSQTSFHAHPRFTRIVQLWGGNGRYNTTRSFYRQQVAATRTPIGKDTRDAAVNKAVHTAGSLWPGLQLIQWSELHNIPGITAYTVQTLLRLKANRLSMWNYEKADLSCSNPECSQVVQSSVQHLFWECPKAKLVWNYFYALWAKIGITPGHDPAIWIFSLDLPDTPRHAWTTIKRHIIGHKFSNEHLQDHLYPVAHMLWRYMSASLIHAIWCAHLRRMDSDPIKSTAEMAIMMTRLEAGMQNLTRLAEAQAGDSDGHTVAAVLKAYVDCFLSQTDAIPLTPSDTRGVCLLFFDGGSRGNPGPGGTGSIIVRVHKDSHTASLIWAASMAYSRKDTTNNFAEYWGLIHGLREAQRSHFEPLYVIGDSALVISQQRMHRSPRQHRLARLYQTSRRLADCIDIRGWYHHYRAFNKMADSAANLAMDTRTSTQVHFPTHRAAFNNLTQDLDNDVMHWLMRSSEDPRSLDNTRQPHI